MASQAGDGSSESAYHESRVPIPESENSGNSSDKETLPETKITLFAVKLAILEKVASGLGDLAFIWATVVLLGGFASSLETADFWVVTTILSIDGARIFSRSQEVKWHHETMLKSMATLIPEAKRLSRMFFRCSSSNNSNENSGADRDDSQNRAWMSNVSRLLLLLQLLSAWTCIALSIYRLVWLAYSGIYSDSQTRNVTPALKIFYGLSLTESLLILLEKEYWLWKIVVGKLLKVVNQEYGLGESELHTVERFLYATYSRCVDGSVFDGLKMVFVTHSIELLQSGGGKGQLAGARVLSALASDEKFAEKTLRAIGTRRDVVERLTDMLNFKNDHEQEIRKAAALIISKLVENNVDRSNRDKINRDCIRVTAIDGFMESIASLLYSEDSSSGGFVSLGLTILQKLADERSNHDKIASCRGLLPKIIALIDLEPLERQKLALQIVERLATTTGSKGKALRKQIREIVFSISNLRKVLQYEEESKRCLQILAIDTLTSLASEPEGRESIGSTGGILHDLLSLFFMKRVNTSSETEELVKKAGEALGFLSLDSKHNCEIMMSFKLDGHPNLITSLIAMLNDTVQGTHVARILRNLLADAEADDVKSSEISALSEKVPKFVTEDYSCLPPEAGITQREEHSCEPLEAAIGLAAQFFNFMTKSNPGENLSSVSKYSLISKLVEVFQSHRDTLKIVPNIRRFSLELLIAVMERDKVALEIRSGLVEGLESVMERDKAISEMRSKLVEALVGVMNTTSDWEYYNAFSGSLGLSRHRRSIRFLAESAMELLPGILMPIADSANIPEYDDHEKQSNSEIFSESGIVIT